MDYVTPQIKTLHAKIVRNWKAGFYTEIKKTISWRISTRRLESLDQAEVHSVRYIGVFDGHITPEDLQEIFDDE